MHIVKYCLARCEDKVCPRVSAVRITVIEAVSVVPAAANEHVVLVRNAMVHPEGRIIVRLRDLSQGRIQDITDQTCTFRVSEIRQDRLSNRIDAVCGYYI